jgi:hypothetical protein
MQGQAVSSSAQRAVVVFGRRPWCHVDDVQRLGLRMGDCQLVIIGLERVVLIETGQHALRNALEQPVDVGILRWCQAMKHKRAVLCGEDAVG